MSSRMGEGDGRAGMVGHLPPPTLITLSDPLGSVLSVRPDPVSFRHTLDPDGRGVPGQELARPGAAYLRRPRQKRVATMAPGPRGPEFRFLLSTLKPTRGDRRSDVEGPGQLDAWPRPRDVQNATKAVGI